MFYVYILKSLVREEYYIGSTVNLRERIRQHNEGKERSSRRYRPWSLVYYEAYREEHLARDREQRLKHHGNARHELMKRILPQASSGSSRKSLVGFTQHHFCDGSQTNGGSTLPPFRYLRRESAAEKIKHKSGAGFTLVEALVVVALFSTAMLIAFDLFFTVNKVEKKSVITLKLASDARFAVEAIARDLRSGSIDFPVYAHELPVQPVGYPTPASGQGALVIRDFDGNQVVYKAAKNIGGDPCEPGSDCVLCVSSGGVACDPVTPAAIKVKTFHAYITPASDPFHRPKASADCNVAEGSFIDEKNGVCTCTNADSTQCWAGQTCQGPNPGSGVCENPPNPTLTTIVLATEGKGPCQGGTCEFTMQTTVSSRRYQ